MDKQDYLDFISTVCNECVTKGHNRYAGSICEMSTENIDYCADRVGYKPKSKYEILEGEVKIYEQEGGYCSPALMIGDVDFTEWFEKKYQIYEEVDSREDARHGLGGWHIPGKFRITVEKIE